MPVRPGAVPIASRRGFVAVLTHRLEYSEIEAPYHPGVDSPTLVFLHHGLGSLSGWGDFPRRAANEAGCRAIVYSRSGHGQSDARGSPLRPDLLHVEARAVLPELLLHTRSENPVLVGDREGASIALIHAASGFPVRGVVCISPRIRLEQGMLDAARAMRDRLQSNAVDRAFAGHHRDANALARAFCDLWLDPAMRDWNLEDLLPEIRCPLLILQGEDDREGSLAQVVAIARNVRGHVDSIELEGIAGAPWQHAPEATCNAIAAFVGSLGKGP